MRSTARDDGIGCRVEGVCERWNGGPRGTQRFEGRGRDEAEAVDFSVVVDDEDAVGRSPHVELDAVRTEFAREPEGFDRVLRSTSRRASMSEHQGASRHCRRDYEPPGLQYANGNRFHQCGRNSW